MEEQTGEEEVVGFYYMDTEKKKTQRRCWITYTKKKVNDILKKGLERRKNKIGCESPRCVDQLQHITLGQVP